MKMLAGRRIAHNKASFDPWKGQVINGKYTLYRKSMQTRLWMKPALGCLVILILCNRCTETRGALGCQEHAVEGSFLHSSTCNLLLSKRRWHSKFQHKENNFRGGSIRWYEAEMPFPIYGSWTPYIPPNGTYAVHCSTFYGTELLACPVSFMQDWLNTSLGVQQGLF